VLGLAAAWCTPAAAESVVPLPSLPAATEIVTAVLQDTDVAETVPTAAVETVDPLSALPAAPAQMAAAEPAMEGAVAAPPPEPVAEAAVEAITEPIKPAADPPPAAEALVEQTAPTNMNISVRIDSAGDNGPVAQVNSALGITETSGAPRYQPQTPQYQSPIPDDPAPDAATAAQPTASGADSSGAGSTWTWTWDCGSVTPEIPLASGLAGLNWNWNWNWNCGDAEEPQGNSKQESTPQYQPVVTQYRPININISIRMNSPGNDGPVVQTNVAVAVVTPILQIPVIQIPPLLSPPPAQGVGSPVAAPQEEANALPELASPLQILIGLFDGGFGPDAGLVAFGDCCLVGPPTGVPYAAITVKDVLQAQHPTASRPDITAPERFRAAVAVTMRLAKAAETAARAERTSQKPAATLRPARRPASPTPESALMRDAAGLAPVNAADGRLGYLVVLVLAFAFLIAFADAARSVAAEVRAAGEDPDAPPDRPG
jgi:hypothetical protein